MRKFEHIERTVVVAVAVLFTVAVVVAFARQPKAASSRRSVPPPMLPVLEEQLPAALKCFMATDQRVLILGDSWATIAPLGGEKYCLPGRPISELKAAMLALPFKEYDAIFIIAGIANLKWATLEKTRLELVDLGQAVLANFGVLPVVYDPAYMLLLLKHPPYRYDGCHPTREGFIALILANRLLPLTAG